MYMKNRKKKMIITYLNSNLTHNMYNRIPIRPNRKHIRPLFTNQNLPTVDLTNRFTYNNNSSLPTTPMNTFSK